MTLYEERAHISGGLASEHPDGVSKMHVATGETRGIQVTSTSAPTVNHDTSINVQIRPMYTQSIPATGEWFDLVGMEIEGQVGCWWIDIHFTQPGEYEIIINGTDAIEAVVYDVTLPIFPQLAMHLGVTIDSPTVSDSTRVFVESFGPEYVGRDGWNRWFMDINNFLSRMRQHNYQPHRLQWWNGHNPSTFYDGMGPLFDQPEGVVGLPDISTLSAQPFDMLKWWNLTHYNIQRMPNTVKFGGVNVNEATHQQITDYFAALKLFGEELAVEYGHPLQMHIDFDEPGNWNAYTHDPNLGGGNVCNDCFERIIKIVEGSMAGGIPSTILTWNLDSFDRAFGPYAEQVKQSLGYLMASQSETKRIWTQEDRDQWAEYGIVLQNYAVFNGFVAIDGRSTRKIYTDNLQMEGTAEDFTILCYKQDVTRSLYWKVSAFDSGGQWQKQTEWIKPLGLSARFYRLRSAISLYDLLRMAENEVGREAVLTSLDNEWQDLHPEELRHQLLSIISASPTPPVEPPPVNQTPDVTGKYLISATNDLVGRIRIDYDHVPTAIGYTVWRRINPDGSWLAFRGLAANTTSWADTSVQPNVEYIYRLDAINQYGGTRMDYDRIGVALPETTQPPVDPPDNTEVITLLTDIRDILLDTQDISLRLLRHLGGE